MRRGETKLWNPWGPVKKKVDLWASSLVEGSGPDLPHCGPPPVRFRNPASAKVRLGGCLCGAKPYFFDEVGLINSLLPPVSSCKLSLAIDLRDASRDLGFLSLLVFRSLLIFFSPTFIAIHHLHFFTSLAKQASFLCGAFSSFQFSPARPKEYKIYWHSRFGGKGRGHRSGAQ